MSESKFYHISGKGLFYGVGTLDEAIAASKEGGFIWLDYYKPAKEDLQILIEKIGVHPLSVEDCFDEKQVPKIEYFQNITFIIFKAFSYSEKELFIDEVNLFLGKNFLITVSGHNSGKREPLKNISLSLRKWTDQSKDRPRFFNAQSARFPG